MNTKCMLVLALPALYTVTLAAWQTTVKRVPVSRTDVTAGPDMFRAYCAPCHGPDGKGRGPAAPAVKNAPADLTKLAAKNNGKFPEMSVMHTISSEEAMTPAHGSRDMPVWGPIFRELGPREGFATLRVNNLVRYIESIQAK